MRNLYGRLRQHFGYAEVWWPGSPAEVMVTAMLVHQCDWSAADEAARRLNSQDLLVLANLACADPLYVRDQIRGVAYSKTKAERLITLAQALHQRGHETFESYLASITDTAALRADLLTFKGIGHETADCILTYAGRTHARVVVDQFARRILHRLGVFAPAAGKSWLTSSYDQVQQFLHEHFLSQLHLYDDLAFAPSLPREVALAQDVHAQIVELARHHCTKNNPLCHGRGRPGWRNYAFCNRHCAHNGCGLCPLADICATGRQAAS
jgi:endonuclease-3 related protein